MYITAIPAHVLGLEGQVIVAGLGLEPSVLVNITALSECDTLATDMRCFADSAECYH